MQTTPTGFELTTKYFILNFLYVIFPLTVKIDGQENKGKWGTSFYPTTPGPHQVEVTWKFYWVIPMGKGAMTISVPEGQVLKLVYKAPLFWFLPGKVEPLAA